MRWSRCFIFVAVRWIAFAIAMFAASSWAQTDVPARAEFRDCKNCPELIVVPEGSFYMGVPDSWDDWTVKYAKPRHPVQIRSFALGKFEVTRKEWRDVMGADPVGLPDPKCGDRCPVDYVVYSQVMEYLSRISKLTGKVYRLPSESEWEYACRAGVRTTYCGGDVPEEIACIAVDPNDTKTFTCFNDDEKRRIAAKPKSVNLHTLPVGSRRPNAWGLYDMSGNAREMVQDCWNPSYTEAPNDGSAWMRGDCKQHVVRGGSAWDNVVASRFYYRTPYPENFYAWSLGFRVARDIAPGASVVTSTADIIPSVNTVARAAVRFAISSDGQEVVDNNSSLIWRRCVEGMAFVGNTCTGTPGRYSYKQAVQQIAKEVEKTGQRWRLPTLDELRELRTSGTPLDASIFPGVPKEMFWSATESDYGADARGRWVMDFVSPPGESAGTSDPFMQHRLRLVRDPH